MCVMLLCSCDDTATTIQTPPTQTDSVDKHNSVAMKANQWLDIFDNDSPAWLYDKNSDDHVELPTVVGQQLVWVKNSYLKEVKAQGLFTEKRPIKEDEFDTLMSQFKVKLDTIDREKYLLIGKIIASTQPALPKLDQAGQTLIDSELKLSLAVNTLIDYHDSGEYRQDRLQKAPALHIALVQSWKQYQQASREANATRNALFEEEHDIELSYYKSCGLTGRLAVVESLDTIENIVDNLYATVYMQKKSSISPPPPWQQKVEQLDAELAQINTLKTDWNALSKNGLDSAYIQDYADTLNTFIIQLKLTLRDLGESADKNETLLDNIEQKKIALTSVYNQLITGFTCEE